MLSYGGITRVRFKGCFSLFLKNLKLNRPLAIDENYAKTIVKASAYANSIDINSSNNDDYSQEAFMVFAIINSVNQKCKSEWFMTLIMYVVYYLAAIVALFLHFTGHLQRWNMEWIILVLAFTIFPIILYL